LIVCNTAPAKNIEGTPHSNIKTPLSLFLNDLQIMNIPDDVAYRTSRLLARKEGIFAGMSAGAAMSAALARADQIDEGTIIVILPDGSRPGQWG